MPKFLLPARKENELKITCYTDKTESVMVLVEEQQIALGWDLPS